MSFDNDKYHKHLIAVKNSIDSKSRTAFDYMHIYKKCISDEDYEQAKAITEILKPLGYHTADTHKHIKSLQTHD